MYDALTAILQDTLGLKLVSTKEWIEQTDIRLLSLSRTLDASRKNLNDYSLKGGGIRPCDGY